MPRKKRPEGTRAPNGESSIYLGKDGWWHGRVTVGVKDDGTPNRPHRKAKTEKEVREKVRKLEAERDAGKVIKPGRPPTVKEWLTHWVENIAAPTVRPNTIDGYRVAVYHHLIPGLGGHRLNKIEPEHFEKLYTKITASGRKPATAHQVHRTARVAFNEALRRGRISVNPVTLAKPPKIEEEEIEPYEIEEVQKLLVEANRRRNSARWAIALALGLRQGEVLGLKRTDVDLDDGTLRVRHNRLRPKYRHGCDDKPCGRKPGFCPQKVNTRPAVADVKSRAGRRPIGLPKTLVKLLREHLAEQDRERETAGNLWTDGGWLFASPTGAPLNPNTDHHEWKRLLVDAGIREGRLHDARHTAATVLLILEVADRTAQGLMGWSDPTMARRYQHLVKRVRTDVADKVDGLLWATPEDDPKGATETQTETRQRTESVRRTRHRAVTWRRIRDSNS